MAQSDDIHEDPTVEIPIDGTLDLHTFSPGEVGELLPAYLEACVEKGVDEVRVVHGKGSGTLRRTVQAMLARDPHVQEFWSADEAAGGWGATLVRLRVHRRRN